MVRAADAAAQLMELRETEAVGAVDDDRVRGRHVDAALDDRRADQHVDALRVEVAHHVLELALAPSGRARRRCAPPARSSREPLGRRADGVDVVVQEVDLAAAPQLAQRGLADHAGASTARRTS